MTYGAVAVVPAAGRSERFGGPKLLADVRGEPLLTHTLRCLVDAGLSRVIVVVAPGADLARVSLMSDPRVSVVTNPDPSRGMFSSIQTGLVHAEGAPMVLVLPADMPFVDRRTVEVVRDACHRADRVVVPRFGGRRGHPIALPGWMRSLVASAPAERSLKDAMADLRDPPVEIDVDDAGVLRDVDTQADLKRA